MSQERGQGIGDRAGVARVPETPHAGRYFVTDAIGLACELELTDPIRTLDDLIERAVRDANHLRELAARGEKGEAIRRQMAFCAATHLQAAKQLGLDSRQDAIAKEIPF